MGTGRIYTRSGDGGTTRLGDGRAVSKDSLFTEAGGTIDELNACLGVVLSGAVDDTLRQELDRIQHDIFRLGSNHGEPNPGEKDHDAPRIVAAHVKRLENTIDALQEKLDPLREFIMPGGTPGAAALHVARSVCRRAERAIVALSQKEPVAPFAIKYLNRLSDALFVMARFENRAKGRKDVPWDLKGR